MALPNVADDDRFKLIAVNGAAAASQEKVAGKRARVRHERTSVVQRRMCTTRIGRG
jgi:hypothetical protein